MAAIRSLAKETIIYGLSYSLGRVVNFLLVTFYLTHYVFTAKDGTLSIYQDIYFYIGLLLGVLTLRMETTLFRFTDQNQDNNHLYALLSQLVMLTCLVFLVVVLAGRAPLVQFLQYPAAYTNSLLLAALILVFDVLSSLPFARLRYEKKSIRYAWIKLSGIAINILLVLGAFAIYFSAAEIQVMSSADKIFFVLAANAASSFLTLLFLFPEIKNSFLKADWSRTGNILRYAWPLILMTLVYTVIQNGYTSFLKYLLPGTKAENLSSSDDLVAVVRLAVIMNIFITAFNYAAEPFFFRHMNSGNARQTYARLNLFFVIACGFIYIMTCLNADLVSYLVGKSFRTSLHLLPVFLMANIFAGIFTNMSSWYKLSDRTGQAALISLTGFVLNLLLFVLLVPKFGKDCSAWISLAVYFAMTVLSYIQGQKHFPIPYETGRTLIYLVGSVLIVQLVTYVSASISAQLLLKLAMSCVISLIYLMIIYKVEWPRMIEGEHPGQ